jgi:hypothetical protein
VGDDTSQTSRENITGSHQSEGPSLTKIIPAQLQLWPGICTKQDRKQADTIA